MRFEDVKVFIDPLPFEKDTQELSQFLAAFGEVEEAAWLGLVGGLSKASDCSCWLYNRLWVRDCGDLLQGIA